MSSEYTSDDEVEEDLTIKSPQAESRHHRPLHEVDYRQSDNTSSHRRGRERGRMEEKGASVTASRHASKHSYEELPTSSKRRHSRFKPSQYPEDKSKELTEKKKRRVDADPEEDRMFKENERRRGGLRKENTISGGSGHDDDYETDESTSPLSSPEPSRRSSSKSDPVSNNDGPNPDVPGRTRKRLSIKSTGNSSVAGRSSTSGVSSVAESVTSASEVQSIYETCSKMFSANRINAQNAFNMRLLDCINQMINSPNYDKSNMQLTSSTVEIGTKIYVCRVDNAHSQVMALASEINLNQRKKQKEGKGKEGDGADVEGNPDNEHDDQFGDGDDAEVRTKKKKVTKRKGMFIETDDSKLMTGLEEQNVKYVTRRAVLKKKFNEMISDDLEFDYMSHFLEPEDTHPLQTEAEMEKLKANLIIPDSYINSFEMGRLAFLPFNHVPKFDPETLDIWGCPLGEMEDPRENFMSHDPHLPINPDFAYDPNNRPAEYPDDPEPDNLIDCTLGEGYPCGEDGEDLQRVSFNHIPTLDHLDSYFQRVKHLIKDTRAKFGWCGPNFIRPKSTWVTNKQGPRKPKTKKEPEPIDFTTIDWKANSSKFQTNTTTKIVYDDKVVESWSSAKVIIPFLGIELASFDDDCDPLDVDDEKNSKYIPPIFRLFTDRNRSILDLLKSRKRTSGGSEEPPDLGDGDDDGLDIEQQRDFGGEFGDSIRENNEECHQVASSAPEAGGWQPAGSLADNLLNDDPLSRVSGIDSIQYTKKPKPINMGLLKSAILKVLIKQLDLDVSGLPLSEEEKSIPLPELMFHVLQSIDATTEKLLSVSIFVVALMHVAADKRLFVVYHDDDPETPVVVSMGKNFNHIDHIPMPVDSSEF